MSNFIFSNKGLLLGFLFAAIEFKIIFDYGLLTSVPINWCPHNGMDGICYAFLFIPLCISLLLPIFIGMAYDQPTKVKFFHTKLAPHTCTSFCFSDHPIVCEEYRKVLQELKTKFPQN